MLWSLDTKNLEGPSTQDLETLVPTATQGIIFGTRDLQYWVVGPSGELRATVA